MFGFCKIWGQLGQERWNSKSSPEGLKKKNWIQIGSTWDEGRQKEGHAGANWCQSGVKTKPITIAMHPLRWSLVIGHFRAAEGRSGTLVWRAAKGRLYWMAGVYGGRPKATKDHTALRRAAEGRPCLQFVDLCACG